MKNFTRYLIAAATLVLAAVIMCSTMLTASAADVRTIYIAENERGNGDGSTPDNAMGSVDTIKPTLPNATSVWEQYTGEYYYKNSALYRAAEELKATGGKIVLVGDISIDWTKTCAGSVEYDANGNITKSTSRETYRDFFMPTHGDKQITITNESYGGRLILTEGAYVVLGGKTVFTDLDIVSHDGGATDSAKKNFAICCNGYETVFGEGLVTKSYEGDIRTSTCTERAATVGNKDYFISIAGGTRYGAMSKDTNVTVKSGTWEDVMGANYGNGNDHQHGNVKIQIDGGLYLGMIVGGGSSAYGVMTFGNVDVTINGGSFNGNISASGARCLGYTTNKAVIKINGGSFQNSVIETTRGDGEYAVALTVDCSNCISSDDDINELLNVADESKLSAIVYPSKWAKSATVVNFSAVAFKGEGYDGSNFSLDVTYNNGKTAVVGYDTENPAIKFDLDTTKVGERTLTWTYGSKTGTETVNVLNIPAPEFMGAQVGVDEDYFGKLRFVAKASIGSEGITYNENNAYGFIAYMNTDFTDGEEFDLTKLGDHTVIKGEIFRSGNTFNNNATTRTFCGVFDDISVKDYAEAISVVSYFKFTYGGDEYVRYSPVAVRSVLGVANAALNSSYESADNKSSIQTYIVDKYNAYKASQSNGYDSKKAGDYRSEVVADFVAAMEYEWTPSTTFTLGNTTYTEGVIYTGLPYVENGMATLDEFKSHITVLPTSGTNMYIGPIRGIYDIFGEYTYNETTETFTTVSGPAKNVTDKDAEQFKEELINPNKNINDYEGMLHITDFFPGAGNAVIFNAWNTVRTGGGELRNINDLETLVANGDVLEVANPADCSSGDILVNGNVVYLVTGKYTDGSLGLRYVSSSISGNTHFLFTKVAAFEDYTAYTLPEFVTGQKSPETAIVIGADKNETLKKFVVKGELKSNKAIEYVDVKFGVGTAYVYDETEYCHGSTCLDLSVFDFSELLKYVNAGKTYTLTVRVKLMGCDEKVVLSYDYTKPALDTTDYTKVITAANNSLLTIPENLQKAALDSMKSQFENFNWTPSVSFEYKNDSSISGFQPTSKYNAGQNYRGILYADMRATEAEFGNVLTLESGVYKLPINTSGLTFSNGYYTVRWENIMGNHCSSAMYYAYQQSSKISAAYGARTNRNAVNILLDDIFENFSKNFLGNTKSMTLAYGPGAMYEDIAKWQMGDLMYNSGSGGGHTRMVYKVYTVRDADGKIDPDASYVLMHEQTDTLISERLDSSYYLYINTNSDGIEYMRFSTKNNLSEGKMYSTFEEFNKAYGYDTTWWLYNKYTFRELCGSSYAAMATRPLEYVIGDAEDAYIAFNSNPTPEFLMGTGLQRPIVVESNYPMLSMYLLVKDTTTGETTKYEAFRGETNVYEYALQKLYDKKLTVGGEEITIAKYLRGLSGTFDVSLHVELAKGDITVAEYNNYVKQKTTE